MFDDFPLPVPCVFCAATGRQGDTRTVCVSQGRLSVTWHSDVCPHLAADRILAERERT